jgi:hypothetical protein
MQAPAPRPVLSFSKGSRRAELHVRPNAVGLEVVCTVDGELTWTQTARTQSELRSELERIKADFIARGWQPLEKPE